MNTRVSSALEIKKSDVALKKIRLFTGTAERGILLLFAAPLSLSIIVQRPFMVAATLAYFFIVMGIYTRKRERNTHVKFMAAGIGIDLTIVLTLEFQRQAINTAIEMSMSWLQISHVLASTAAVIFYLPVVTLGILHIKGRAKNIPANWHKRLGITAFVFRTLGFALMFSLLTKS